MNCAALKSFKSKAAVFWTALWFPCRGREPPLFRGPAAYLTGEVTRVADSGRSSLHLSASSPWSWAYEYLSMKSF